MTGGKNLSSTDDTLRAFYQSEIAPLQGQVPLELAPSAQSPDSFYITRSAETAVQMRFGQDLTTPHAIGAALDAHWAGTPLAGLGAKLAELSGQMETSEDTGEVSDLIYEMF